MDRLRTISEMKRQNPWWNGGWEADEGVVERELLPHMLEELDKDRITGIVGLRRVGKTTLMKMIIGELLNLTV